MEKIIHWQIPTALLTLTALAAINWLLTPETALNPLWQLFSGATMFCAFLLQLTLSQLRLRHAEEIVFGALIGFLIYIIRYYGNYPDAVAFSILLANICVPLIDHYTRPRVYGYSVKNRQVKK